MLLDFPLSIAATTLLAFFISYGSIIWIINWKNAAVLDYPNSRSLHTNPVPRIGGAGLLLGVVIAWVVFSASLPLSIWLGIIALIGISIVDDIWKVPVRYRLFVHLLVALGFCISLLIDTQSWLLVIACTIAVVWMSNLFNFMDGSDGLAGGMVLIGFGFYGLAAILSGDANFALVNFSITGASLGFLRHNFYPARIFLGDVGAIPLGYLAAVMGILGWVNNLWSLWVPLLIFSPFIADATVTLIKRLLRGERIWLPHCEHYYQRLVRSGLGHKNTALMGYSLMLVVGATAVWVNEREIIIQLIMAVIWGLVYLGLMLMVDVGNKLNSGRH